LFFSSSHCGQFLNHPVSVFSSFLTHFLNPELRGVGTHSFHFSYSLYFVSWTVEPPTIPMASVLRIGSTLLLGAALVSGQTTTATTTSIAPAQQTVSADSNSSVPLNTAETVQLTTEVLQNLTSQLNDTTVSYFNFGNDTTITTTKRSASGCKVFPGDKAWPVDILWDIFDLLLGGRLIKTVPSASSCYSGWGDQNAAECAYVNSEWTDSHFQ
jgi:hypothetical protein